jgi:DNA-binding NarL/FixJ family response regulator
LIAVPKVQRRTTTGGESFLHARRWPVPDTSSRLVAQKLLGQVAKGIGVLQPHVPASISVAIACADGATLDVLSRIVSDDADLFAGGIASDTTSARSLLRDRGLNVLVICLSSFHRKRPSFGIDFVEAAIHQRPDIGILVLAHETDKFVMREALEIGATACSLLNSPAKRLIGAIKAVSLGVTWLDREIAETLLRAGKTRQEPGTPLTRREHSVLHLIAEGYSEKWLPRCGAPPERSIPT